MIYSTSGYLGWSSTTTIVLVDVVADAPTAAVVGVLVFGVGACVDVTVGVGVDALSAVHFVDRARVFSAANLSSFMGPLSAAMVGFDALSSVVVSFGTDTSRATVICVCACALNCTAASDILIAQ